MSRQKIIHLAITVTEDQYKRINYLKSVYGIVKLSEFWNFCLSITLLITKGILAGKKLALYDPESDAVEIITHERITTLETLRDEK